MKYPVFYNWGALENIIIKNGMIQIVGWAKKFPKINIGESVITWYRIYRPDVAEVLKINDFYYGFIAECIQDDKTSIEIEGIKIIDKIDSTIPPHYPELLNTELVYKRNNIYGQGSPNNRIDADILPILTNLRGFTLDFGCGNGKVVNLLVENNIDAYGIEINRAEITESLIENVKNRICLYDGNLPLPYSDNQFNNVICIEVLEHIDDFINIIKEFSRISKDKVLITVPDISAIPRMHQFGVIPWHLLEATHVNFFTQQSLNKSLQPFFKDIQYIKICPLYVNGEIIYQNLVAVCNK